MGTSLRSFFRRRRLLVRDFQRRLILFQILYFGLLTGGLYLVFLSPLLTAVQDLHIPNEQRVGSAWALILFDRRAMPVLVPLVFVLFAHSIVVSHRIAGPLYRMTTVLRALAAGDLTQRFRIRPRDYLQVEATELQGAIQELHGRLLAIRGDAQAMRAAVDRMAPAGSPCAVREALAKLETRLEGFVLDSPRSEPAQAEQREAA